MRGPGERSGRDHICQRIGRKRPHEEPKTRYVFVGRSDFKQVSESKQHEPEADSHPPKIASARCTAAAEHYDPDQNEQRREASNLEREHLDDKRRADVCAKHDREGRHELEGAAGAKRRDDEACGRAALQNCGRAEAGGKRGQPITQRLRKKPAQVRTESAQDAALDHVYAPEEERGSSMSFMISPI